MGQLVKALVSTDFDIDISPSTDFIKGVPFIESAIKGITSSAWALGVTVMVASLVVGVLVWVFGKVTGGSNAREKGVSSIFYPIIGAILLGGLTTLIGWAFGVGSSDGGSSDSEDTVETSQVYLVPQDGAAIELDSGVVVVVA